MAERRGPTDGRRFKRVRKADEARLHPQRGKNNQPLGMDRGAGETLLTDETRDRLVGFIRLGNYAHIAAAMVGISRQTFSRWLTRGARGEEPFKALCDAVEKAAGEAEAGMVAQIRQHGSTHWQALAWMLERSRNKRWGRRDALELSGDQENPVEISTRSDRMDLTRLSTEELRELKRMRTKAKVEID